MSRIRRYPSARSTERAVAGVAIAAIGLLLAGLIAFMWMTDANPPAGRAAVILAFALAVTGLGAGVALHRRETLIIDLDARRAEVPSRNGASWVAPLHEVGPVAVIRVRRYLPNSRWRERIEYRVVLAGARDWDVYQAWSFPKARGMAERLARDWGVGLAQLDGRVRVARELDAPLWRLSSSLTHGVVHPSLTEPLDQTSGVLVTADGDRATFQSTRLGTLETAPNILILMWAGMAGLAMSELPVQVDIATNLFARAGYWSLAIVAVLSGGIFLYQAVQWLLPARVTIARDGVSYRGRTIALTEVREVVTAPAVVIAGPDGRALALEPGFSTPDRCKALADEIRRLIVEHGRRLN